RLIDRVAALGDQVVERPPALPAHDTVRGVEGEQVLEDSVVLGQGQRPASAGALALLGPGQLVQGDTGDRVARDQLVTGQAGEDVLRHHRPRLPGRLTAVEGGDL